MDIQTRVLENQIKIKNKKKILPANAAVRHNANKMNDLIFSFVFADTESKIDWSLTMLTVD